MRLSAELFINDLEWPDAEGIEAEAHATVECVYDFTPGYPADRWEPAAPDEVELLALRVTESNVAQEQWLSLARYIKRALSEWIEDEIMETELGHGPRD